MKAKRNKSNGRWWLGAVLIVVIAFVGAFVAAWCLVDPSAVPDESRAQAWQSTFTMAFGVGGLATLGLFARKQWYQEKAADHVRHDADERRITELYVQAVELVGHERASVRLGGMYALDRLGRDHPDQRQVVADVWCGYLRRRFPHEFLRNEEHHDDEAAEEFEVRCAVQRLLESHLKDPRPEVDRDDHVPEPSSQFWLLDRIDLSGAVLFAADFADCWFPEFIANGAQFDRHSLFTTAHFLGRVDMRNAQFRDAVTFRGAQFLGSGLFQDATFHQTAQFHDAVHFRSDAQFRQASFRGITWFDGAHFHKTAGFYKTSFQREVDFNGAHFHTEVEFCFTCFEQEARFLGTHFHHKVRFNPVEFSGDTTFDGAHIDAAAWFENTVFGGTVQFKDLVTSAGTDIRFHDAMVKRIASSPPHLWPPGWMLEIRDDTGYVVKSGEPGDPKLAIDYENEPVFSAVIVWRGTSQSSASSQPKRP